MNQSTINKSKQLAEVRSLLKERALDAVLVRSTDGYFNEYVPTHLSARAKITGFDGSIGDAIITKDQAHLFVDGRYSLQAKSQSEGFTIHVCSNAQSIESSWLASIAELLQEGMALAYDPRTIDLSLFERLSTEAHRLKINLDSAGTSIIDHFLGSDSPAPGSIYQVSSDIHGKNTDDKLLLLKAFLKSNSIDGLLLVKLDDIAWMSNLRSHLFPYQSAPPGIACILPDRMILGLAFVAKNHFKPDPALELVEESEFFPTLKSFLPAKACLGIDAHETSKAHEMALQSLFFEIKRVTNPVSSLKAIKNEKELLHLRRAFNAADRVVHQTQNFVVASFERKEALSEAQVDLHVKNGFTASGAQELSFRPICASGKNGAIIHYGHPDHQKAIEEASLFLLDTGAYYEGGYATDLTRTFLAAGKNTKSLPWQKEIFTLVLKASIRGLSARIKRGVLGAALDAIVREPLWRRGLDFAHGTGHGVGINVHEFPPRIGPLSKTPLLEGQVFSIEPGLYFENLGGVRIENLATLVADPKNSDFLRVLPLTFCPFDDRLIDHQMLDKDEEAFLKYFEEEWHNQNPMPNLPPLPSASF